MSSRALLAALLIGGAQTFCAAEAGPVSSTVTVRQVAFEGNKAFADDILQKQISLQPGHVFAPQQLVFSQGALRSFYQNEGYYAVQVSTHLTRLPAQQVDILFAIQEGAVYYVGRIVIDGNHSIDREIIERSLGIAPGDRFSQARIFNAHKQLYLTGFFRSLDVTYSTSSTHVMDIHLHVVENPTRFVKSSVGYGAESKERVSVGYEDRNFFGNARNLSATVSYSGFITNPSKYRTILGVLGLSVPHIWHSKWDAQNSISQEWANQESFDSRTTAFRSRVGRRLGTDWRFDLGYRYEGTQLINPDPSLLDNAGFTNVSAIGPGFVFDDTDDAFLPSKGWRGAVRYEQGMELLVGTLAFYKWEVRLGRFHPLPYRWTFFTGAQFAVERPKDPGTEMPVFERFMIGGASTVRGYSERTLGPKDAEGNPAGGEAYAVGNFEVRHQIYKKLYGVVFLDGGQLYTRSAGQAWPTVSAHGTGDFRWGSGAGIRLHTPVGAIRLELGYQLNPEAPTRKFFSRSAVHFSLGEVF